jgi:hypothetical protein
VPHGTGGLHPNGIDNKIISAQARRIASAQARPIISAQANARPARQFGRAVPRNAKGLGFQCPTFVALAIYVPLLCLPSHKTVQSILQQCCPLRTPKIAKLLHLSVIFKFEDANVNATRTFLRVVDGNAVETKFPCCTRKSRTSCTNFHKNEVTDEFTIELQFL